MQVEAAQGHLRLATCWVLWILAFTKQNPILLCESSPNLCFGFVTSKGLVAIILHFRVLVVILMTLRADSTVSRLQCNA